MTRFLLAALALLVLVPAWAGDPAPAARAGDYPATAPAPGAPVDPATKAGLGAGDQLKEAAKPWYTDLGTIGLVGGTAALVALEKAAPQLLMRFLPMAGPYGGALQLLLQGVLWFLKPKAQKDAEQLQADHADAFRLLSTTLQGVSNFAPVQSLKARLTDALEDQPELKQVFADFVAELEAQGVDHDTHGTAPLPPGLAAPIPVTVPPATRPAA
jgi:hypothetical protein